MSSIIIDKELLIRVLDTMKKSIEFIPTGYGIERAQWNAITDLENVVSGKPNYCMSCRYSTSQGSSPSTECLVACGNGVNWQPFNSNSVKPK
jgi:hypothetical protein